MGGRPRISRYVSTHSRLKAAGFEIPKSNGEVEVSTHSRLKAAGQSKTKLYRPSQVSTHSRLKAAGESQFLLETVCEFQHTAA